MRLTLVLGVLYAICAVGIALDVEGSLNNLGDLIYDNLQKSTLKPLALADVHTLIATEPYSHNPLRVKAGESDPDNNEFRCNPQRIFFGMVDFHSTVHAHWAIVRIARYFNKNSLTGAADWENKVRLMPLFSCSKLIGSANELIPEDEVPYGHAWTLLLYREWRSFQIENSDSKDLEESILKLEHDLEGIWNLNNRDPELTATNQWTVDEYLLLTANRVSDDLDAWFRVRAGSNQCNARRLRQSSEYENAPWALYHWFQHLKLITSLKTATSKDRAQLDLCKQCIQDALAMPSGAFIDDETATDFFSVYGNNLYLASSALKPKDFKRWLQAHPYTLPTPVSMTSSAATHNYALNLSRAWALKALLDLVESTAEKQALLVKYEDHITDGLTSLASRMTVPKNAPQWHITSGLQGDFDYTHWVGQFAVYALTQNAEEYP